MEMKPICRTVGQALAQVSWQRSCRLRIIAAAMGLIPYLPNRQFSADQVQYS
jgi:hypothetical protein